MLFGDVQWFPDYYRPRVMAFGSFFYIFLIESPLLVFRNANSPGKITNRLRLQKVLAVGLILCGLGSLGLWGLYHKGIPYDKFVHFGFPMALTVAGIAVFKSWYGIPFRIAALRVFLIVSLSAVAWEVVESVFARYFHIGFFGALFDRDSLLDIVFNVVGLALGILVAAKQSFRNN